MKSYTQTNQLNRRIHQLVHTATSVTFKVLESELQALLVEAELIRTYQPKYNVALKDDKSPIYIHITEEEFPKVIKVRKRTWIHKNNNGTILGPFPSAFKVTEVLRLVRPIFTWCNKGFNANDRRPCFFYHIDQCPGVCVGKISAEQYQQKINMLVTFLRGKKKEVQKEMQEAMKGAIAKQAFEEAARLRDQLAMIDSITLSSRKLHPTLITPILTEQVATDQLHYLRKLLSNYLSIPKDYFIERIEGYDVSNTQGTNPAVSMVTFTNGKSDSKHYRLFNIRSLQTPNDYQMMKEAISRRQNHPEWGMPQLVIVDGGKGQVKAALSVWRWQCPIIGIAKNPDRLIVPLLDLTKMKEGHPLVGLKFAIPDIESDHPALRLVQQIRNESHRFAKKQHSKLRLKSMLQ